MCHDDTVADFGGNDGFASYNFYVVHKIKPLVIDCEPHRLEYADKAYGLSTYQTFIERMPELANKGISWGFCSHTLEHTRDTSAALREMSRIIKYGCYFIVPLERLSHGRRNHAHAISVTQPRQWKRLLTDNGWRVEKCEKFGDHEAHLYAEPR